MGEGLKRAAAAATQSRLRPVPRKVGRSGEPVEQYITLYAKNGGTITASRHKLSDTTSTCMKCSAPLVAPPAEFICLKADKLLCEVCSGTGAPEPSDTCPFPIRHG